MRGQALFLSCAEGALVHHFTAACERVGLVVRQPVAVVWDSEGGGTGRLVCDVSLGYMRYHTGMAIRREPARGLCGVVPNVLLWGEFPYPVPAPPGGLSDADALAVHLANC